MKHICCNCSACFCNWSSVAFNFFLQHDIYLCPLIRIQGWVPSWSEPFPPIQLIKFGIKWWLIIMCKYPSNDMIFHLFIAKAYVCIVVMVHHSMWEDCFLGVEARGFYDCIFVATFTVRPQGSIDEYELEFLFSRSFCFFYLGCIFHILKDTFSFPWNSLNKNSCMARLKKSFKSYKIQEREGALLISFAILNKNREKGGRSYLDHFWFTCASFLHVLVYMCFFWWKGRHSSPDHFLFDALCT